MPSINRFAFAWICLLTLLSAGCQQRQEELVYVYSQAVQDLPEDQQEQIHALLTRFYGTPDNPRLVVLDEEAAVNNDGAQSSASEIDIAVVEKLDPDHLKLGAAVYRQRCASCHGVTGDGAGPAAQYLNPKPRDYRQGVFKFTSTGRNKPRKADLIRTVKYGARGTSMPSFRWLPQDELSAVVDYVILLAQRGETEIKLVELMQIAEEDELEEEETRQFAHEDAKAVFDSWKNAATNLVQPLTPPPPITEDAIQRGRETFLVTGCAKCHGTKGEGYTSFAMKDDWGNEIHAADLTSGMFHGGRREIDIYRRIYAGIGGTPMPASVGTFRGEKIEDADERKKEQNKLWDLTYYVLALSEGQKFPYVSIDEANRMALEHSQRGTAQPMPEAPMPKEEPPQDEQPQEPPPAGERDPSDTSPGSSNEDDPTDRSSPETSD